MYVCHGYGPVASLFQKLSANWVVRSSAIPKRLRVFEFQRNGLLFLYSCNGEKGFFMPY